MIFYLTPEELAKCDRQILEGARRTFAKKGEIQHHFVSVKLVGGLAVQVELPIPRVFFASEHLKDVIVGGAREYIKLSNPVAFYFVAEQWMREIRGESREEIMEARAELPDSLGDDPESKELLMVHRELPDGSMQTWMAPIIRPSSGRAYAGEFSAWDHDMDKGSRFAFFYYPNGAPVAQ